MKIPDVVKHIDTMLLNVDMYWRACPITYSDYGDGFKEALTKLKEFIEKYEEQHQ